MKARGRAAAALLAAAIVLPACGDPSAFPDPAPCPSPTPVSTPTGRRDQTGEGRYRQVVFQGVDQLAKLVSDFRLRWPDGKFSRDGAFRPEFARYADATTCAAHNLAAYPIPLPAYAGFKEGLDAALNDLIAMVARAREGVKSRNVSDYRDWNDAIDGKINTIRATFQQLPR